MDSLGSTPGGASILITSAPKSARMRQQVGPARTRVRSSTRRCDSARDAIGRVMASSAQSVPYILEQDSRDTSVADTPRFRKRIGIMVCVRGLLREGF